MDFSLSTRRTTLGALAASLALLLDPLGGNHERALELLPARLHGAALVVDPPRAGLHPKVARALAGVGGDSLVYVACKPGSLGRDAALLAEGGWRLAELWPVDLFPQTGHMEVVGRLVRSEGTE